MHMYVYFKAYTLPNKSDNFTRDDLYIFYKLFKVDLSFTKRPMKISISNINININLSRIQICRNSNLLNEFKSI